VKMKKKLPRTLSKKQLEQGARGSLMRMRIRRLAPGSTCHSTGVLLTARTEQPLCGVL